MLHFKAIKSITAILLVVAIFTACKKDAFNEKDAIAAQTTLLQQKYDQEVKLEQLKQSGATALAQLQYNFTLQINAAQARLGDSLSRAYQRYLDSLTRLNSKYNDSINRSDSHRRDIVILVRDQVTLQPVSGATVTVPTLINSVLQVTTDANGIATFPAAGNVNVANPASALVTKTGYGSGSTFHTITGSGTVVGTATITIWNQKNNRNTIKGTVSIQTNFVNPSAEFAPGKLVNVFANVIVNGQSQRFDWSSLTDAGGNYSISVPDLPSGSFNFSHNTFDTTAKLAINGFVPDVDSIPSIQSVPATYYLGTQVNGTTGSLIQEPANAIFGIPFSVARYHAVTPLDSNGRAFYFRNLTINTYNNNNVITGFLGTSFGPSSIATIDANGNYTYSGFVPRFSGTSNTTLDSLPARLVDVMNNADGYWTRAPLLNVFIAPGPNKSVTSVNNPASNNPFTYSTSFTVNTKRAANQSANNNYDPAAWGLVSSNVALTTFVQNKGIVLISSTNANSYSGSTNSFFTSVSVSGGQTAVLNLTYGVGQLKQTVR